MKASLGIRSFLTGVVGLGLTCLLLPSSAMAISGQCANCHTMHNSQDGAQVSADAGDRLLKFGTCIGCHTGDNAGGAGVVPYVMAGADPGTDYLAGGNFFWVSEAGAAADTKGHNVASVKAGQDANMPSLAPPGWDGGAWATQLKCAGAFGCHGDKSDTSGNNFTAMSGSHHGNASGSLKTADTIGNSFRFLEGIYGLEGTHFEYQGDVTASQHNQYYAIDRSGDANEADSDTHTISSLCAQCHGKFHNDANGGNITDQATVQGPWVRHPTDYDMDNVYTEEYGSYGGATNAYQPLAPVGSDATAILATVTLDGSDANNAIVMCISCHRAHGSPYSDLLRWSYGEMTVGQTGGGAGSGCFLCHTTKDGV